MGIGKAHYNCGARVWIKRKEKMNALPILRTLKPKPAVAVCLSPFPLPQTPVYNPASNASFEGVAAIRLINHSIADCGGICASPRRSV